MAMKQTIRNAIAPVYIRARLAQEWLQSGVVWYPLSEGFVDDPYPTYRKLREKDPYHRSPLTGALVISRYEDVDAILRDYGASATTSARAKRRASAARARAAS